MIKIIYNKSTRKYRCELWASSTKHPDTVFHYEDFEESEVCPGFRVNYFAWLMEIASKMNFPTHTYEIAKFAIDRYENADLRDYIITEGDEEE